MVNDRTPDALVVCAEDLYIGAPRRSGVAWSNAATLMSVRFASGPDASPIVMETVRAVVAAAPESADLIAAAAIGARRCKFSSPFGCKSLPVYQPLVST